MHPRVDRPALCLLLCAALGGAPSAQQPQPTGPRGTPLTHAAAAVAVVDGRLVAGGADYKVHFAADGRVEFTPALPQAPRNLPLGLRLREVRRGGDVVFAATGAPAAAHDGLAVRLRHRDDLVERYDVRAGGIEQSFVFAEPLGGAGDLVVCLDLDTELAATMTGDGTGVALRSEFGGVDVGAVTGIDSNGERAAGSLRLHGSQLDLVLPAGFVQRAAYPLVLDPWISPALPLTSGWNDHASDSAYDGSSSTWLVVYERRFSATDVDIRAIRVDDAGAAIGSFLFVTTTADMTANPSVGNCNHTDRFLVAWQQRATTAGSTWNVRGCTVDAATGAVGTAIDLASGPLDEVEPDVASEFFPGAQSLLLVCTRPTVGVIVTEVDVPPTGVPVVLTTRTIANATAAHARIAKNGGSSGRHLVVFSAANPTARTVFATVVNFDGTVLATTPFTVSTAADSDYPDCDGDGVRFLVVWQQPELAPATTQDCYYRGLRYTTSGLTAATAPRSFFNYANFDQIRPAVADCGSKFFAVVQSESLAPPNRTFDALVQEVSESTFINSYGYWLPTTTEQETRPAISCVRASTQAPTLWSQDVSLSTWSQDPVASPGTATIVGRLQEAVGAGGAVTTVGTGCGNGGTIGADSPFALANFDFQFTLTGADPAATFGVLSIAFPAAPVTCGSCTFTNPLSTEFAPVSGGAATMRFALPVSAGFVGVTVEAQWATLGGAASPCPAAAGVSASARLRCTVGN
jgi:hypothetical protein